jgi:hypothetical protein
VPRHYYQGTDQNSNRQRDEHLHSRGILSEHNWDPQNVQFPEASRTVEEELSRTVDSVSVEGNYWDDSSNELSDSTPFDIGSTSQRMISSINVHSAHRQDSQVEVQDVPQARTSQSKGRHSSITPEDWSERWHIGLVKRTSQRLVRSAGMPVSRRYRAKRMFSIIVCVVWEVTRGQPIRTSIFKRKFRCGNLSHSHVHRERCRSESPGIL